MMKLHLRNYRVIKQIGQGGMGVVYVAEDLSLGRLVALKVLAPYLVQDPEILERFRFEARNQAQLTHPNITTVYSFLEEDEKAYLVLEFIDGETLESRINREGRIPARETVAIFRKILSAMEYAHYKGVIHRDIKPGNIAFTGDGTVKIMDFGIALNMAESGRLTRTGHVLGTPHYMAPEQILSQNVTFATDIYALGITLFEMLTGRLPFDSKSDFEVRVAQINHPPPSLQSFGYADLTPELEEVVLKALAKAPGDRFASAGEFRQALEVAAGPDHLATMVKGLRLDQPTQMVKSPRNRVSPVPPPVKPEIADQAPLPVAPGLEAAALDPLTAVQEVPDALPAWSPEKLSPPPPGAPLAEMASLTSPSPPLPEPPLSRELAAPAIPEEAPIPPAIRPRWFSRARLILVPLALLPVLAVVIFFRLWGLGPAQPGKQPQVAAPVSPALRETQPAKAPEVPAETPAQEKPLTLATAPPPEKKAETQKAKEPQPDELRKAIKDNLAANGFSDLEVQVEEGKGVIISGNVKNAGQKKKIIQIIDAMSLAVPMDYGRLKIVHEPVAKTVKPKRLEAPATPRQTPEAAPKPAPAEASRKPLPPRIDRGNIQF